MASTSTEKKKRKTDDEFHLPPPKPIRRNLTLTFHCIVCNAWSSDFHGYRADLCGTCYEIYPKQWKAVVDESLDELVIPPLIEIIKSCGY